MRIVGIAGVVHEDAPKGIVVALWMLSLVTS